MCISIQTKNKQGHTQTHIQTNAYTQSHINIFLALRRAELAM